MGSGSGPRTFSALAFSNSFATASICAVAATAALVPNVLRKERREMEKPSFDLNSLMVSEWIVGGTAQVRKGYIQAFRGDRFAEAGEKHAAFPGVSPFQFEQRFRDL